MLFYTCKASRYCGYITWNLKHSEFIQTKTKENTPNDLLCYRLLQGKKGDMLSN